MNNLGPSPSFVTPVSYTDSIKDKVDFFNGLPRSQKVGTYWDNTEDGDLADVKKAIKDHYKVAQDYHCPYCRQRMEVDHNGAWDAEHIIPKDSHPQFMFEPLNLCVSCKDCNLIKLNKRVLKNQKRITFPNRAGDYVFCHPNFHNYSDHVRVIKVAGFYLPRTEEGKNLIEICGLLRFVLKYSEYDCQDDTVGVAMVELGTALMNSETAVEKIALMAMMKNLVDEGLRKSTASHIRSRVAVPA